MKNLLAATFLAGLSACPTLASAAPLRFALTGDVNASFVLDSEPSPVSWSNIYTEFQDVVATLNGSATNFRFLSFYVYGVNGVEGGLQATSDQFQTLFDLSGIQLFSGPTRSPVFATGTYGLTGPGGATTLTVSAVPLPAAAPLFGAAVLALGIAGYGRKRRSTAAA